MINNKALFSDEAEHLSVKLPYEGLLLKPQKQSSIARLLLWLLNEGSGEFPKEITFQELRILICLRLIIPKRFSLCAQLGITSEARSYENLKVTNFQEIKSGVVLIGSAVDYAQVGDRSSFVGPKEIRKYVRSSIQDVGNVAWFTSDSIDTYGLRVAYCMYLCYLKNSLPIVLGGDHSITKFCFREVVINYGSSIGLIHFDAHNDLGDTESENNLGNLMHSNVIAHVSQKDCEFVAQIGLRRNQMISRSPIPPPLYQLQDSECGGSSEYLADVSQKHPNKPVYISVDIDCLDPKVAGEVAAPLEGGIDADQLIMMIRQVFSKFNVIGMDLVEVCGASSGDNNAAKVAARIIEVVDDRFH